MTEIFPMVSIIIPCRNEENYICLCLESIIANDYPKDRLEVLIVDGMSEDGTRAIVQNYVRQHSFVRLLDNPKKVTPFALNIGIREARGEIVARIDGHCLVARDFVRQNVAVLAEHPEALSVGGPIVHTAHSLFGRAIAVAMSHPLGVGKASHRFSNYEGYAEGAQFPAVRRWVFERIGKFDEDMVRNQDDEFNFRIIQSGGKIYVTPRIRYAYFVRERAKLLFRQYFQYGFWRIPVIKKHRRPTSLRQIAPSIFYLLVVLLFVLGILAKSWIIALGVPALYGSVLLVVGTACWPKVGFRVAWRIPIAIGTMHAAYALGFMYGLWASLFQPDAWNYNGRMAAISR